MFRINQSGHVQDAPENEQNCSRNVYLNYTNQNITYNIFHIFIA